MQLYAFLILCVAFWILIENRRWDVSSGLGTMAWGCGAFAFGLALLNHFDVVFCWMLISFGLFMALLGTARYILRGLKGEI